MQKVLASKFTATIQGLNSIWAGMLVALLCWRCHFKPWAQTTCQLMHSVYYVSESFMFMFASCLWLINLCMQTSCHRATNLLVMDTFANVLVLYKTLFIILDKYIWANFSPLGGFMFALMFFGIHFYLLGAFWALWSQFCRYFGRGGPRNTPLDDFLQMFLGSVNYPSTSICLILADFN